MRAPRAAVLRAEDLAAAFSGASLLAVVELLDLGRAPGALQAGWVVAGLYAGVGLLLALALTLSRLLGDQGQRPLTSAIGAALLSVFLFLPLAQSLFQGAWAARLPGARLAVLWLPVLGVALTALAVWAGGRLTLSRLGRLGLGIGLPVIALELDILNRNLLRSEYPDLHTILLLGCCLLAAVGVRLLLEHFEPERLAWTWGRVRWPLLTVTGTALALLVAALAFGLRDKAGRRVIADHGMQGRLLARAAKAALDLDGDGYAAVLGGGDCREGNASIHPDARDIIRNGVDEDCDGSDQQSTFSLPGDAARRERLARWREEDDDVRAFIRRASHMNVLLVVVDALRADTFTPTPENMQTFPNVFDLRRRARWFTRAFAPAAGTDLSMTGVLTGKANPMTGSDLTLTEVMTAAGYTSHAVIPEEVLRFISPTMLTRGFASHDMIPDDARSASANAGVTSGRTTWLALRFLDGWAARPDRPFFLWVHYFDVHEHHQIRADAPAVVAANGGQVPGQRRDRYRAMVKVVDGALGRLQQGLAQRGLADNTIIVLLSDHGESLGEAPRLPEYHGRFLYNPLVHVPLAVLIPGLPPAGDRPPGQPAGRPGHHPGSAARPPGQPGQRGRGRGGGGGKPAALAAGRSPVVVRAASRAAPARERPVRPGGLAAQAAGPARGGAGRAVRSVARLRRAGRPGRERPPAGAGAVAGLPDVPGRAAGPDARGPPPLGAEGPGQPSRPEGAGRPRGSDPARAHARHLASVGATGGRRQQHLAHPTQQEARCGSQGQRRRSGQGARRLPLASRRAPVRKRGRPARPSPRLCPRRPAAPAKLATPTPAASPPSAPPAKLAPGLTPAGGRTPPSRRNASRPTPPAPPWRGWDPVLR